MVHHDTFKSISMFAADIDQWARCHEIEPTKAVLSQDEVERAERFKFDELTNRFIWGRIFLRTVLGTLTEVGASEVQFEVGFNGKPFLAKLQGSDAHFSFSRSGRFVACCFTSETPVGIDIELPKEIDDLSLMSKTIFSPERFAEWDALPAAQKRAAFYRAWRRKEAVSKIDGRGISHGVADIEVPLQQLEPLKTAQVELDAVLGKVPAPASSTVLSDWKPFDEVTACVAFGADISEANDVEFCDHTLQIDWEFPIVSAQRQFSLTKPDGR